MVSFHVGGGDVKIPQLYSALPWFKFLGLDL
jgi:hypothetical protein